MPSTARSRITGGSALLAGVLLAAGCAAPSTGPKASAPSAAAVVGEVGLPVDGGLVLLVEESAEGFAQRSDTARLPLVAVYADGRVITRGMEVAVFPGPALPGLQVATLPPGRVEELVRQALDAGVGQDVDRGLPDVEGAPLTTLTVVTPDGTRTTEVHALRETAGDGEDDALTEAQLAARRPLQDLVDDLLTAGGSATEPYAPAALAALVDEDYEPGADPDDVATWRGPPLPGDLLGTGTEVHCVIASGADAGAVTEAAAGASTATVWANPDGGRWAVSLRPLLPHEASCADLPRP